jgi:hypothetical protein
VKSQIWIAVSVHVPVAIVKKRLGLDASLYRLLQILSVTIFEKMRVQQAIVDRNHKAEQGNDSTQLDLFVFYRTLLIRNSVCAQIVFLIPAHWVGLQLVDYF